MQIMAGNQLMPGMHKAAKGFTLLELIVTLAVAAVLVSMAVPTLGQFLGVAQRDRDVGELRAEIILARSEAIRRGSNVGICASETLNGCSTDWSLGWIVYVDADQNGVFTSGEEILRRHKPSQSGITITSTVTDITFIARGGTSDTGGIRFTSAQQDTTERLIRVDRVGQPRVCKPQADVMFCEANS